jgi:imidazolonepropionase-like amidohydrolase
VQRVIRTLNQISNPFFVVHFLSAIQIFKNARVIDGSGNEPVDNGGIIIDGPKIIHAGEDDSRIAAKYPRADVIDLDGMTLMPGLIDAHVHLSLHGSPSYFNEMNMESPTLAALKAVKKVNRIIESGFTTIRTMGDKGQLDIAMKTAIREGDIIGPRLSASGNCLTIQGDMVNGESAYELECLVDNGFTEMQAIQAATKTAVQALLLPDLGTLEAGNVADFIVVDGNPLQDIKILQNVEKVKMVFQGGELVLSKPLSERRQ